MIIIVQFQDVLKIILLCLNQICINHFILLLLAKMVILLKSKFVLKKWMSLLNLGLLLIGVIKKAKVILPKRNKKKLEKNFNGYENLFLCQMISKMAMPKNIMTPFLVIFLKLMFMF